MSDVELREVREADSKKLFDWVNNRDLRILSATYRPVSWMEHQAWLEQISRDPSRELLIISIASSGEAIGQIILSRISSIHRSCELSIRIADSANRGRGYGSKALELAVLHATRDLGLHRIELNVFETNHRAIRVYEKVGFKFEGSKIDGAFIDGSWVNVVMMALITDS